MNTKLKDLFDVLSNFFWAFLYERLKCTEASLCNLVVDINRVIFAKPLSMLAKQREDFV